MVSFFARPRPLCFSQSAEVTPKVALPAAQVSECLAAAILSPRALFRLASSPFVSEPKLVVFRGTKPNIDNAGAPRIPPQLRGIWSRIEYYSPGGEEK
ncbi:hypothetical protein NDU88_001700 [Pleurodeles waltl]|uniref:Uncharacterized protein n=1 Tax=Pleurodeles waltl TaxID=8319 RepID=A0AAV7VYE2_PLEWA|nr:hypothetical protein NDU88_001700 [Pleurodeles waltl]